MLGELFEVFGSMAPYLDNVRKEKETQGAVVGTVGVKCITGH